MKKIILFLLLLVIVPFYASAEGLKFLDVKSLQEAIDMAKKDDKILMVEMYRVNCPACVRLETKIFPADIVGNTLNPLIYCYRTDGEKGEGIDIMKKYRGVAFPTFFFFKDGNFIERSVGTGEGPEDFIERLKILLVNYELDW